MQERKRQEKRKKLTCDNRDDETSASPFPALSTRQKASCRGPGQWGVVSRSFGMDGVKLRCRGIRCKSESHVDPPDRLEGSPTRRWSTTYERQLVVACSNFVHLVAFSFSNEPPPFPQVTAIKVTQTRDPLAIIRIHVGRSPNTSKSIRNGPFRSPLVQGYCSLISRHSHQIKTYAYVVQFNGGWVYYK